MLCTVFLLFYFPLFCSVQLLFRFMSFFTFLLENIFRTPQRKLFGFLSFVGSFPDIMLVWFLLGCWRWWPSQPDRWCKCFPFKSWWPRCWWCCFNAYCSKPSSGILWVALNLYLSSPHGNVILHACCLWVVWMDVCRDPIWVFCTRVGCVWWHAASHIGGWV